MVHFQAAARRAGRSTVVFSASFEYNRRLIPCDVTTKKAFVFLRIDGRHTECTCD
jgi:hypothetical protein